MDTQSGPAPLPPTTSTAVGQTVHPPYEPVAYTKPPSSGPMLSRAQIAMIVVGVIVVLALACGFLVWLNSVGGLRALRDVLIVFLAFESIFVFILLAWLLLQVQSLVEYMNNEVKPILASVQESAATAKTTTVFLRDTFVDPVITAQSRIAGIRQGINTLLGRK